jgi:hypothetical protein
MKIKVLFLGMAQKSDDVKLLIGVLKHRRMVIKVITTYAINAYHH